MHEGKVCTIALAPKAQLDRIVRHVGSLSSHPNEDGRTTQSQRLTYPGKSKFWVVHVALF